MPQTLSADTVGPVDVAVVAFPGNRFNGEIAPALRDLRESGTVRILDLTFVAKDADGSVRAAEITDAGLADMFTDFTGEAFDLLSDQDLEAVAAGLEPDSSAVLIVWENTWAARLSAAVRGSRGEIALVERIPHETVVRAIDALDGE
jgi:uncharacterized membrane protein